MRVRTLAALTLIGALLASGPWSQAAGAKAGRTVKIAYTGPAAGALGQGGTGWCSGEHGNGCVLFNVQKNEHRVSIVIKDDSGQPVYATYGQSSDKAGGYGPQQVSTEGGFCGKTKKPVAIKPGKRLTVFLYEGPGPDGCPGVASNGTVTATFTK